MRAPAVRGVEPFADTSVAIAACPAPRLANRSI
jgi:hypothetical protein